MSGAVRADGAKIIAVDNSRAMVAQFRKSLDKHNIGIPIRTYHQDILETSIDNASVVVLNYTLQFLSREQRQQILTRIATGMRKGGVLIISEKICFEDEQEQQQQTSWHHDFKRTQGYSELEIARKRDALEDVLRPDTEQQHLQRFKKAGFSDVRCWFQCFSFASYIAFR